MRRFSLLGTVGLAILLALCVSRAQAQTNLAWWTFATGAHGTGTAPQFGTSNAPTVAAERGLNAGNTALAEATGFHTLNTTIWSGPAGNGSLGTPSGASFSSNVWSVGDYYQFKVNTTGDALITVQWDQAS